MLMKKLTILAILLIVIGWAVTNYSIPQWQQAIKIKMQQKAMAIVQQGWNLETQGRLDQALALYNQALAIDPNCAVAYKHLGTNFSRRGAFDKAIPQFKKAISLDPSHASSYYNLGTVYISAGQYDNAILSLTTAINLNPNYSGAILNRATAYLSISQYKAALEDYSRYLELVHQDKKGYKARAYVEWTLGIVQDALDDCNKALAIDSLDTWAGTCKETLSKAIQELHQSDDYIQASKAFIQGNIHQAHTLIEKALAANSGKSILLRLKLMVDAYKDKNGKYPDYVKMEGNDLLESIFTKTGFVPQAQTLLGKGTDKDMLVLPCGRMYIKAPGGWKKEISQGSVQYSLSVNADLPKISVTVDSRPKNIKNALEYTSSMRQRYLQSYPGLDISSPNEEAINGQTFGFLEYALKGLQDIRYHVGIYYILTDNMVISLTYQNTDYQFQQGMKDLRSVAGSVVFE